VMKPWDEMTDEEQSEWWEEKVIWNEDDGVRVSRRTVCEVIRIYFDSAYNAKNSEFKEQMIKTAFELEKKHNMCTRCRARLHDGCTGDC